MRTATTGAATATATSTAGLGVPLRCAPGRAARALGHDTTVPKCAEPPPHQGTILLCPAAPGSRPCGRASLTRTAATSRPLRRVRRGAGAPLSRPLHHKLRGGEVTRRTRMRHFLRACPAPPSYRRLPAGPKDLACRAPEPGRVSAHGTPPSAPSDAPATPAEAHRSVPTSPLPRSWGRGRPPREERANRRSGERAPAGAHRRRPARICSCLLSPVPCPL
jgi:hypothetical protein